MSEFIHPDRFARLKVVGMEKGFRYVESGPLVRSSYHAEKHHLLSVARTGSSIGPCSS